MNELKKNPEIVKAYIAEQFQRLVIAYDQNIDQNKYENMLKIIYSELEKRQNLRQHDVDKTYKELLNNFTTYRKVCPASYMTAFAKMNHK